MNPLNRFTTTNFIIDATSITDQLYLIDSEANLYMTNSQGALIRKKQILKEPPANPMPAWSAALSAKGDAVLLSGSNIRLFSFNKATNQRRFSTTPFTTKISAIHSGFRFVATIDEKGFLSVGSLSSQEIYFFACEIISSPTALFFSEDGRWLFVANAHNEAFVYDLLTLKLAIKFTTSKQVDGGIFLSNGRLLLTGSSRDLYFYSWHSKGVMLGHLPLIKVRVSAIMRSEKFAFVGLESGALAVIDTDKMELFRLWDFLDESVVFLKRCGNLIVAGGNRGEVRIFDATKNEVLIRECIKDGEFTEIKKLVEENIFLLANSELVEFLEELWEKTLFPSVVSLLEQGETKRALTLSHGFLDDPAKKQLIEVLISLGSKIKELKNAVKTRDYDKADELLNIHKVLRLTASGKIYHEEWINSYNSALDFLELNNQVEAKKSLELFLAVKSKTTAIETLINFPNVFIKARSKLLINDIKGFFEDVKKHPILTTMPHYHAIIDEGKRLEKELCHYSLRHDYKNELKCAKELIRFAPFALKAKYEIDRLKLELLFQDSILKQNFSDALNLANEYIFLLDSASFAALYAPYQKRLIHAEESAKIGDSASMLLLLQEYIKNPILKESASFLFRICYANEMKNQVIDSVINWKNTFDNYTKLLGADLFICKLAKDLQVEDKLIPYISRKNLRSYENYGFIDSIMNYNPLDENLTKTKSSTSEKIVLILIIVVAFILTTFVLTTVMERPIKEYKEEIKRDSPYKLFENLSKRQQEGG